MSGERPELSDAIQAAARRLRDAERSHEACAPIRDLIGADDIAAAYATQSLRVADRLALGSRIVGRKIGLTSVAVQTQLGVDQPDFGVLFDDMVYGDGDTIPARAVLQPKAEAEIAFVLKDDLVDGPLNEEQVRAAIDYAVAAIEVCGSRVAGWDVTFGDTVADNASAGAFVLGAEHHTLDEFEPRDVAMRLFVDGDVVSTGSGAACLGDPINAVAWLAKTARDFGSPLRSGQVILSGALGAMRDVKPGSAVQAEISSLGTVGFVLDKEQS